MAAKQDVDPIVSVAWLKDEIAKGNTRLRILDVSWDPSVDYSQKYLEGHIPGASYFNLFHKVTNTETHIRNLPSLADFDIYQRAFGINPDTHIVAYDGTGQCGWYIGGRAWWLFRLMGHTNISILDGGFQKWKEAGNAVSTEVPKLPESTFRAKDNSSIFKKNYDDMKQNVAAKVPAFQMVDVRPPEKYKGDATVPKSGHIPGAKNIPFGLKIINKDTGLMRTKDELKAAFKEEGIDLNKPIVSSCMGGLSACSLAIAAVSCGAENVAIYHGSATEWLAKSDPDQCEKS